MNGLSPLHPHQLRAIDDLRQSLRTGHRRPMLCLPTGSGKTVIGAHIAAGALAKGKRVGFVVPKLSLVDQTFDRFLENGISAADIGVIQADHEWRRPHAPIQICSAQTLARRGMPEVDVLVIDEAHILDAKLHSWLESSAAASIVAIGLSATPWSKGLGRIYDDLIAPISIRELIDQGHLSPFRVFAPSHPDLIGVRTDAKSGDWQTSDLSERMSKPKLVCDVVEYWLEHGENRPTLCFGVDRPHAALLAEQFEKSGVSTAYVDALTPRDERAAIARKFQGGEIKVVVNIATMTTGVDLDVRCLILARPTKSEILFTQIIGRALRPANGKSEALIFDHSDTHLRLGLVTDLGQSELDCGKPGAGEAKRRRDAVPLPKECHACGCLVPAGKTECHNCGAVLKRVAHVTNLDGELIELHAQGQNAAKAPKGSACDTLRSMGRKRLFAQLEHVRQARGRSSGWTAHTFRDITGVFPRGLKDVQPEAPTLELLSFVRRKDIAFAKSRRPAA